MNITKIAQIVAGLLVATSAAQAAEITWTGAQNTATKSDVSTQGSLVQAINATNLGTGQVTVNNVTFTNSDSFLNNHTFETFLSNKTTGDAGYDTLLSVLDYGSGNHPTIQIGNGQLISGHNYLVQVWYTDLRSGYSGRTMTFSGGAGQAGVTLSAVGTASNTLGQFATGTFTANNTSQDLVLQVGWSTTDGNAHISAFQVRDVTVAAVPEPETYAMLLAGLGIMGAVARRKKQAA